MPQFPLLSSGCLLPTMPAVPSWLLALGQAMSPLVLLQVPLGGTVWKDFFARCLPPVGIQKREFLEGITLILASQYPHFPSFSFLSIHPASTLRPSPPLRVSHRRSAFTKHVCQTREARALLGHHLKLNHPVLKIAFSVKLLSNMSAGGASLVKILH